MTKISDVEANLEQFKSETLASQEETRNLFGQMRESIDRNKVEADKQFAEIMQQFKALRLSIAMAATITPPATHPATLPPPLPHHIAAAATPHHPTPLIPLNSQNSYPAFAVTSYPPFPSQPSAAYTSFSGLRFDSQGFPLPMTHAGEFSVNHNHCPPVSSEGIFQNYPGNTFKDAGGIFANTTVHPTATVHGSKGLKRELRTAVRTQQPAGLGHTMELALVIDESQLEGVAETHKVATPKSTTRFTGEITRISSTLTGDGSKDKVAGASKPPLKRMSEADYADKKAKGLCFRCDEKFAPGHRCPENSLRVMLRHENEDDEEEDDSFFPP
ncbi:hypothetical protein Tco_1035816 [Tanacetum coccineum]